MRVMGWLGVLLLITMPALARDRSRGARDIDQYCKRVIAAEQHVLPFVFAGPDPWVQLDDVPARMPDSGIALVYTIGPGIRWVFLRIVDRQAGWSEDVDYFFGEDGSIEKRERHLQLQKANLTLEVSTWYRDGAVIKEHSRHHAIGSGHEDKAQFTDPDAPTFWTVDDLPFPEIPDLWDRLS